MFLLEEQPPLLTLFTWQICKWLFWIVINLFHGITYNLRNHYRSRITKKQKFIFISLNLEKKNSIQNRQNGCLAQPRVCDKIYSEPLFNSQFT